MFQTIRARVLLASVGTFALMLGLLQWSAQRQLGDALAQSLHLQGELARPLLAAAVAPLVASRDYATLEELVRQSVGAQGLAAMDVRDQRGERLAAATLERAGDGPVLSVPLSLAGQPFGEVRMQLQTQLLTQARQRLWRDSLWIGLSVLVGGTLLLALMLAVLSQGAQRLLQASRRMAAGEDTPALPETGAAEVRALSVAFNRMVQSVRSQMQAVRASEQQLRSVVAALSEGLIVQARDGRVIDCNEAAAKVLRTTREDLLRGNSYQPRHRLLDPTGRPLEVQERPVVRTLATGQAQRQVLLQIQPQRGGQAWIIVNCEPVNGDAGHGEAAVVTTLTDVTARIQAQDALQAANQSLEQRVAERTTQLAAARDAAEMASRAKSEFLSRMSHELRTPLNAILGFAQLLALGRAQAPAAEREQLRQIETAGWHLLELIDEVLDLARIEAGAMSVSLEPVELAPLMGRALEMARPLADAQQVRLHAPVAPGLWVRADRRRLLQVLSNLLSNAIKYNHAGGEVRVELAAGAGSVHLSVSDTGRGMSADQLAQLFEPFTRFEDAQGPLVQGTGIGLTITRRLVELMHGRLDVRSSLGQGSEFSLSLPASASVDEQWLTDASQDLPPPPAPMARRVVYVEDNPSNVRLLTELLAQRPGVSMAVAHDGPGGWALLCAQPPDLAVIDIDLPGFDGIELCRRLKANEATRAVPLMALSAQAMAPQLARMRAAGFDAIITKPLQISQFLAEMDRLLADPRPAQG